MKKLFPVTLVLILVFVNGLMATQATSTQPISAHSLPPGAPTPTPLSNQPNVDNPPPRLPSPTEASTTQVRQARQAMEAALVEYIDVTGPDGQIALSEVVVEDHWAYGVIEGQDRADTPHKSIHVLAHLLPNGTWQVVSPARPDIQSPYPIAVPRQTIDIDQENHHESLETPALPHTSEIKLNAENDGDQIVLQKDQVLVLNLNSNLSTGYVWEIESIDRDILSQVGTTEFNTYSREPGSPDKQMLRFVAVAAGKTTLNLVCRRPWETSAKPLKTYSIQVQTNEPYKHNKQRFNPTPPPEPFINNLLSYDQRAVQNLPSYYNWCDMGKCTPIRDQSSCGSCWAFSTVGVLESNILIHDAFSKDISEQYLVSCNTEPHPGGGYWGCNGGWWAHDYHQDKVPSGEPDAGAVYESEFPYQAADVPCNAPHEHYEKIVSWAYVDGSSSVPSTADIKQAIYDYGPVAASICAGPDFGAYSGGVFQTNEQCYDGAGNPVPINHAIVLVGWDDSQGVWYLRNSWGTDWGENGYMRIKYGISNVGYGASYVVYGGIPLHSPTLLSPGNGSTTSLRPNFDWTDASTADHYTIQVSQYQDFASNDILQVTTDSAFTPSSDLVAGRTYYWRVWAMRGEDSSDFSETWQFTTATDPPPTATPSSTDQVKLYELANYAGNVTWSGNVGFSNDPNADSFSLEIPSGWSVKTWREDNRGGEERCWDGSVHNLQDHGWHLAIQSIEVFDYNACPASSGDVVMCTTDDALSGCWIFPQVGVYDLTQTNPSLNDQIRSIKEIPDGMSVMLFREGGLRGTAECYDGSRVPLPEGHPWDLRGQVTDVQVFSAEGCPSSQLVSVILYDGQNHSSHYWGLGHEIGLHNMRDIGGLPDEYVNDRAESIRIPNGWSVRLYEHDNRGGQASNCLTGDVSNLGDFNNTVSSADIFHNTSCSWPTPATPSNLTVSGATANSLMLSWQDNSAFEDGFYIYRWGFDGTDWGFLYHDSVGANVTSFTDTGLACETTYYYQVSAYNTTGESAPTDWSDGTTSTCPPAGPILYDSHIIDDDTSGNSEGNDDGVVDCGETIELYAALYNQGSNTATGTAATISTSDPYVSWLFNTDSDYPDLSGGGTDTNSNDFDFVLSANAPDGHIIHFDLTITADEGGPWTDTFDVPVDCTNPPQVKLYSLDDYDGTVVFSGEAGFSNAPNADSASMYIPNGWSVQTWRGDDQTGEERCWVGSVPYLAWYGWENAIQSIQVFTSDVCSEVRLYDEINYGGAFGYVNNPGRYTMEYGFNDMTESVQVPSEWSVRLFKDNHFYGPQVCIADSDPDLWDNSYDDGTTAANSATTIEVYDQDNCPPPPPKMPSNLAVTDAARHSLSLAWQDNSDDEDGFNIYRWGFDGSDWAFIYLDSVSAEVASFTDVGLDAETTYYYTVSAFNSHGESLQTDWIAGTTLARLCYAQIASRPTITYTSVQAAVDAASEGDTIKTSGNCTGVSARQGVTQVVYISKTVTIRGGYVPENGFADPPDPDAHPTTLDAQGQGRVLYITGDIEPTIEGLQITNGYADGGGGIYINHAAVTIHNNRIFNNVSPEHGIGGGVQLDYSEATLSDNLIYNNTAKRGGGLWLTHSDAMLSRNTIAANLATENGGGIYLWGRAPNLVNNVIVDNYANNRGGGVYFEGSSSQLLHNTLASNMSSQGAGVYVTDSWGNPSAAVLVNTILVNHSVGIDVTTGNTATLEATLWGTGDWANQSDWSGDGTLALGNVNVWGNPGFANPATNDYHIWLSSAAVDRGVDAGVTHDIDHHPRPQGSACDIGADEPGLILTKRANPAKVQAGAPLTYTISMTNASREYLTVAITDVLPAQVNTTQSVVWTLPALGPEEVWTETVVATVETDYAGLLTNVVYAATDQGVTGVYTETSQAVLNHAPYIPSNPGPAPGATNVPLNQTLSWSGGDPDGDPVTYTVAFGTGDPPPTRDTEVALTHYKPGALEASTTYYWRITAMDGLNVSVGPIWSFITASSSKYFVYLPVVLRNR